MAARERHARASQLFMAALDIEPRQRARWLDEACSGDDALRVDVASLLDGDSLAERVLHDGALGNRIALTNLFDELELADFEPLVEAVPSRIGRYRVIELIGHGGMGVVYLAEQDHPARTVALKLLRTDTFSPARRRRFELEAEILGRLQHRGIAQIHEAGTADTDAGPRAFIAMELVRGRSLLEFASARPLREKIDLVRELCAAVQHAHQHGVIHRDLKPANVLVDESGQPKILDFGVARAEFDAETGATLPGELVGTLYYMSPEQLGGGAHAIDTRCDVYALGLIAFELIAGRPPHDFERQSWPEIARAIREDAPRKLRALDRTLPVDLETIVAKALEKDRERRYSSAAELGNDLGRFLRDEPIAARAPSTLYQLAKFARRNRVLVAGITATFVALVLGVIGTGISLVRAKESERAAERETKVRTAILDYTTRVLAAPDPSVNGRDVKLMDVLDQLAAGLDTGFENEPEVESYLRSTVGWTFFKLGLYDRAEPHVRRAFELRRSMYGLEHVATLESITQLVPLLAEDGRVDEVEPLCRDALEASRRVLGPDAPTTLRLEEDYAGVLRQRRRFDQAEPLLLHSVAVHRKLGKTDRHLFTSLGDLALVYIELGRLPEAEALLREALEGETALDGPHHPETFQARNGLGLVLRKQRRHDEARAIYEALLDDALDHLPFGHPTTIEVMNNLSRLHLSAKRADQCERYLRDAFEIATQAYGHDHVLLQQLRLGLCSAAVALGREDELEELTRESFELCRQHVDAEPTDFLASATTRAWFLSRHGRPREAEDVLCEAIEIGDRELPELDPKAADARFYLVQFMMEQERFAQAEPLLVQCNADYERRSGADARSLGHMIDFYERWGLPELAAPYRERLAASPPPPPRE